MVLGKWLKGVFKRPSEPRRTGSPDWDISIEFEETRREDPPNLIRVNETAPKGFRRKLHEFVPVAGVTMPDRIDSVVSFIAASERHVHLRSERDNPVDPNAVAVHGRWYSNGGELTAHLGYLQKDIAKEVVELVRGDALVATIAVLYAPLGKKSPGIRLNLWTHARKPKKVDERPFDSTIPIPSDPIERNLQGKQFESEGLVKNAIAFYQENVADGFDGSFPYERLAVIYRRA